MLIFIIAARLFACLAKTLQHYRETMVLNKFSTMGAKLTLGGDVCVRYV